MAEKDKAATGITSTAREEWPKLTPAAAEQKPLDRMVPTSDTERRVREYFLERIRLSEEEMNKFYPRWNFNEKRAQAYIDLPDYERQLKRMNDSSLPPSPVSITVPYIFATNATISTYLLHTFTGRKPIFQVGSYGENSIKPAKNMEIVLQWNADQQKLIADFWQFFNDISLYGMGIIKCVWKKDEQLRTVWRGESGLTPAGRAREYRTVFEGNETSTVDPFMFFPDPRVPMNEVNQRGEFVFWRSFHGVHKLRMEEVAGRVKWITHAKQTSMPGVSGSSFPSSDRDLRSEGEAHPGRTLATGAFRAGTYLQIDQGTCWLVPKELGIGESEKPELWIGAMANKSQMIQLEPLDNDHSLHPIAVTEPLGMGYGFGQVGTTDMLSPIQDLVSWFINSHIDNVKAALNNMFLYDPSMVESQDIKRPGPRKLIRLKKAAYGTDVRTVLQQLEVNDVTKTHVQDVELLMRMGDSMSSISDNLRGVQDAGGRKTATEVRTTGEAAASRLAAESRVISAQGVVDLTKMMSLNVQQHMTVDFFHQIIGQDGEPEMMRITPEHLVGDFNFPIHDGNLPLDRVAMLDTWKEIFLGVAADEQLRQEFSLPRIFEWVAELGGARNIQDFRVNVVPDDQAAEQIAAGNGVPIGGPEGEAIPGAGGGAAPNSQRPGGRPAIPI